jgi:hypothetical protein
MVFDGGSRRAIYGICWSGSKAVVFEVSDRISRIVIVLRADSTGVCRNMPGVSA